MFYAYEWIEDEWRLIGAGTDLKALEMHCEVCCVPVFAIIGGW